MNDRNQSRTRTGQPDKHQSGGQAFQKSLELPFNQMLSFQKMAAELVRNGLEMSNWAQSQNAEVTKETLDSYIETLDRTTRETEKMAERGVDQLQEIAGTQQQIGQQQLRATQDQFKELGQQSRATSQQASWQSPGQSQTQQQSPTYQQSQQPQQFQQPQHVQAQQQPQRAQTQQQPQQTDEQGQFYQQPGEQSHAQRGLQTGHPQQGQPQEGRPIQQPQHQQQRAQRQQSQGMPLEEQHSRGTSIEDASISPPQ